MADSIDIVFGFLVHEICGLKKVIKGYDKANADFVQAFHEYPCLVSIPEISPVFDIGLLAEISQIDHF